MPSGGGSTNDIEAGGAFIRVHTKDDATREMKVIFGNLKSEGAKAAGGLSNVFNVSGKSILKGAGIVGLASELVKPLEVASQHISEWAAGTREANREFARMKDHMTEVLEAGERFRDDVFGKLGGKMAAPIKPLDEAKRMPFAEGKLKEADAMVASLKAQEKATASKIENLNNGFWNKMKSGGIPLIGSYWKEDMRQQKDAAQQQLDFIQAQKTAQKQYTQELRGTIAALRDQQKLAEGRKSLNWWDGVVEFEQSIKIAEATMGKTAEEAQAIRMAMLGARDGIKDATNQAENLLKTAQSASKVRLRFELDEKSKGIAQGFEDQLMQRAGMSGTDVQMFRLEEERKKITGRLDPNLAGLAAMQKDLDAIDKFKAELGTAGISKVKGAFGGDMRSQLGIGDSFTKPVVSELKNANEWLKKIAERELVAGVRFG